jgi:uncharacterized membrane protein
MQTSIFLAKLLGPVFCVLGAAILVNPQSFRAILGEFIESRALLYLAGFLGLLGGMALVLTQNVWSSDWRVLITLIGWITVMRALTTIFLPQQVAGMGLWFLRHRAAFPMSALLMIAIGGVLSYFGYSV